jgi:hypothetical protein
LQDHVAPADCSVFSQGTMGDEILGNITRWNGFWVHSSLLRFMSLSFRDLSFGGDMMDGAPHGLAADFIRGVIRWLMRGSVHKEMESAPSLDGREGRTPES